MSTPSPGARAPGSQTLARGLDALKAVVDSHDGLTPQELAKLLGVHRTIAYRILVTLSDAGFATRGEDGRYRGGIGLFGLARGGAGAFRQAAMPILRELADASGCTASLLIAHGDEALAVAVVESSRVQYRISFAEGSSHPISRAAGGLALRMQAPPTPDDEPALVEARELGYAHTYGEVESGAHGLAAPVRRTAPAPAACVNLITHREELIEPAIPMLLSAATQLGEVDA